MIHHISKATAVAIGVFWVCLASHLVGNVRANEATSGEVQRPNETEADPRTDWPMWRYDAARSAESLFELAEKLHLQWVRQLPRPQRAWPPQSDDRGHLDFDLSYSPVVLGRRILVPSMVTDSVTAYDIEDGAELWRFYADGPVRLAPAAWNGRVYFVSDDGHLYCVDASNGGLVWKFRAGPTEHRLLGNERVVNFWAARGGPVVKDGTIYFAAGIWPMHGVFIYALDAKSGEVVWVNDTVSSDLVPDFKGTGGRVYGAIAPQGYLAASEERLVVSGGRSLPVFLNRHTGEVEETERQASSYTIASRTGGPGHGGYAVHALNGGGMGVKRNSMLQNRVDELAEHIDGDVFCKLAAHGRLIVTTEDGTLYCFGPESMDAIHYAHDPSSLEPRTTDWAHTAEDLLDELGEREGYALMLGAGSADLLRELLARSSLHVVVVEACDATVRGLRDELADADVYGRRAAVIEADPAAFAVQPYLFSIVVSEDAGAVGIDADVARLEPILDRLRPYGGVAWLGAPHNATAMAKAATAANVDQVVVESRGDHLFAKRGGPLTGAGRWTHQYHDPANTLLSLDERVRLPLGVLWFGGPAHHNLVARHSYGPRPHVVGGRQVVVGEETISARCVYTGRELWERKFAGVGYPWTTVQPYRLGAAHIGSPFVTLPDGIYLRYEGRIYRLDPATGKTLAAFRPPGRSVHEIYDDQDARDWGHISVQGDYLITTSEPHLFENQELGRLGTHTGTSSRRLAVMDRHSGAVYWQREARIGFRHTAVASTKDTLFVVDGVSESVLGHLARRGRPAEQPSVVRAIDLRTGEERWSTDSNVFGTFLLYSEEHDILVEGGSRDGNWHHTRILEDEPTRITARRGHSGEILWERGDFTLPAAVRGDMLIPGRTTRSFCPGEAISLLMGERWLRPQSHTGALSGWSYRRGTGCDTMNASVHLLLFRSGTAGYFDLEHESGTGFFGGFRSGCTSNMVPADGVLSAPDYTRTCTCAYPLQTSLALIHMPDDPNIEFWTRYDGARPNPKGHGINFGAPGRRVDRAGLVWHDAPGTHRRHASAVIDGGGSIAWVVASAREGEERIKVDIDHLLEGPYMVRIHFAELRAGVQPGQRLFDVLIDGETVLARFDIVAKAGGCLRGTVQEFAVNPGATMIVELRKSRGAALGPIINGLELVAGEW